MTEPLATDPANASSRPSRDDAIVALTAPGQRYELATIDIDGVASRVFVNAPMSLREMYEATATDACFIVYDNERLTFAQAWVQSVRIAHLLVTEYGVRKGDRVAISMRNYPEWMTAFAAITSIGAIAVALNAMWTPEEMAFGLRDCGATVLFADQERIDRYGASDANLDVRILAVRPTKANANAVDLNTALAALAAQSSSPGRQPGSIDAALAAVQSVAIAADDGATMFYTSGSTGHPKGVVSTHRNVLTALLSWELDARTGREINAVPQARPDGQAAALLGIPLFHVTGTHAVFLQSYRAQRKLVAMYRWDPDVAAELIERERITSFIAPAALTGDLVRVAKATQRDLSSLISVGGGGAARAPEQVKEIGASFGRALPNTGWGMTETNAIGAGIGDHDYLTRPASSGRCAAVLDLRIIDEDGKEQPTGARGELLVRGTSVFRGYWNRPDANADAFVDGWFRTGDVAYLDDDGYLFIVDRIKDLIIRGGENIGGGQVEAALVMHPDVHEAAAYAIPDERLGEEVGATIHGTADLDIEAIREFVRGHLPAFAVPRYLDISVEPLPRTASGKILKRELRDVAVARHGA